MSYNQQNGGAAIVAAAHLMLGARYTQAEGENAHDWQPGDPVPTSGDCSGSTHFATAYVGCDVGNGSADDQWQTSRGGHVPATSDLAPGDIGAFLGVENTLGYAGHTAVVNTYNPSTRTGTIIGEYDTALGDCILPFNRDQATNGNNGLGVLGFYRPANSLPPAPVPPAPQETEMIWLDKDPNNNDAILVVPSAGGWFGLGAAEAAYYLANGVTHAKTPISKAVFTSLKKLG